ncbi:hypothetical protein BDV93DRAFT_300013 [Ceratobasidium sp. AG-I]|nr:hypothetical protein BDV93DRAFT_300013 [Ceratobasidium sp. AG-I]
MDSLEPRDERYSIASSMYSQSQETYETHEDTSHLVRMSRLADNPQLSTPSEPATRPPLLPRRSSQRLTDGRPVSAAPPSTFSSMQERARARQSLPLMRVDTDMSAPSSGSSSPAPPAAAHARRQNTLDTPDTPIAGPSSHLLPLTRTSTPSTSSPSPSPSPYIVRSIPDDVQTPRSSVPLMNNPYMTPRSTSGPFRPLSSVSAPRKGFPGTGYARESIQPAQPTPQSMSQRAPPQPVFVLPLGTDSTLGSKSAVSRKPSIFGSQY